MNARWERVKEIVKASSFLIAVGLIVSIALFAWFVDNGDYEIFFIAAIICIAVTMFVLARLWGLDDF